MNRDQMPKRISICGCTGSGKSTLGKRLSRELGIKYVELDALFHLENWGERPDDEFLALTAQAIDCEGWVVDGNYKKVRSIVWAEADTVIFLDYPFVWTFLQLFSRTMRRRLTNELLWNGNRESFRKIFFSRESILLWCITSWRRRHQEATRAELGLLPLEGKRVLRFRSRKALDAWVAAVLEGQPQFEVKAEIP